VHVFSDRSLFQHLYECENGVITSFDGQSQSVLQKGPTKWGEAYYLPSCPLNLVSVYQLSTLGYKMKMTSDARGFVATSPNYEFVCQSNCLLNHQLVVDCCAMAVDHFTVEQKRRAALVRQLHYDLNHPSGEQLCDLLESTCLLETPLTAKDVRVSERINGACPHCLVGKFPTPPALPSQSVPASAPGELLHTDIAFFSRVRRIGYPTWLSLTILVIISIVFGWRGSRSTCF
jgi:hypothetical protein